MRLEEGSLKIGGVDITPLVNEYLELKNADCPKADDLVQQAEDLDNEADEKTIKAHMTMAQAYLNETGSMLPDPTRMAAGHQLLAEVATRRLTATRLYREARELRLAQAEKLMEARVAFVEKVRTVLGDYLSTMGVQIPGGVTGPLAS